MLAASLMQKQPDLCLGSKHPRNVLFTHYHSSKIKARMLALPMTLPGFCSSMFSSWLPCKHQCAYHIKNCLFQHLFPFPFWLSAFTSAAALPFHHYVLGYDCLLSDIVIKWFLSGSSKHYRCKVFPVLQRQSTESTKVRGRTE